VRSLWLKYGNVLQQSQFRIMNSLNIGSHSHYLTNFIYLRSNNSFKSGTYTILSPPVDQNIRMLTYYGELQFTEDPSIAKIELRLEVEAISNNEVILYRSLLLKINSFLCSSTDSICFSKATYLEIPLKHCLASSTYNITHTVEHNL